MQRRSAVKTWDEILPMTPAEYRKLPELVQKSLTVAAGLLKNNAGCTTPEAEFIDGILMQCLRGGLTPQDVDHYLREFRANFEDMKRDVLFFIKKYPEVLEEAEAQKKPVLAPAAAEAIDCILGLDSATRNRPKPKKPQEVS